MWGKSLQVPLPSQTKTWLMPKCQAFHNPPAAIATLFRHALTELPEFQNQFEVVVFSIIERSGSNNLVPWKNVCKEFV